MSTAKSIEKLGNAIWVFLDASGGFLCNKGIVATQVFGCLVLFLLGAGWTYGATKKVKQLRAAKSNSKTLALSPDEKDMERPGVSIVLPVKGVRQHSVENWKTQLALNYEGNLEFIFVVESWQDLALAALTSVIQKFPKVKSRIEVAGPAKSSSQKIHNMLHGLSTTSSTSKYVIFLDDDVALHSRSASILVDEIENDESVFLVTGYPFDIPLQSSNLLTYCTMAYHLPLMIPFSVASRTSFVWGGCMLLKRSDLLKADPYNIIGSWREGGYSDDLIMAGKCAENGLVIAVPTEAVFPQRLESTPSWNNYWNYLRRQLYVCDTYASIRNKRINHTMVAVHVVSSIAFTTLMLGGIWRVLLWQIDLLSMLNRRVFSGEDASVDWPSAFDLSGCPASTFLTISFLVTWIFATGGLVFITSTILQYVQEMPAIDSQQEKKETNLTEVESIQLDGLHYFKVWLGMLVTNGLLPICALYTFLEPTVSWSGLKYYRRNGKIIRVEPKLDLAEKAKANLKKLNK
ncbi:hypothetical protein BSKO_13632 [Bryopsis sp. KO-2023]|nr:hypothetical protein BSKO_13632 [Bryopsis sp. KO-2023]